MTTLLAILHDAALLIGFGFIGMILMFGLLLCLFLCGAAIEDLKNSLRRFRQ